MSRPEQEYWTCIIGPCRLGDDIHGPDFPMRQAVKAAFVSLTGNEDYTCTSGWGITEADRQRILDAWNKE